MASECEVKEQLVWNVGIQVFLLTSQHLVSTTVRFLHEVSLNSGLIAKYMRRVVGKDHLTPASQTPMLAGWEVKDRSLSSTCHSSELVLTAKH